MAENPYAKYVQQPELMGYVPQPTGENPYAKYAQPAAPQPEQAETPAPTGMDRATYQAQRLGRATADILGAPVDLTGMGVNALMTLADWGAGMAGYNPEILDNRVPEAPVMGSEWIANAVSDLYERLGGTVVDKEMMSPGEQILGEALRFGGGAGIGGGGLIARTKTVAGETTPLIGDVMARIAGRTGRTKLAPELATSGVPAAEKTAVQRGMDYMAAPYGKDPTKQVAGDIAAGAGAGVMTEGVRDLFPEAGDTAPAQIAAALVGGVGGATGAGLTRAATKGTVRAATAPFRKPDANAPINPMTGKPFDAADMDMAAAIAQNQATDVAQAVDNIETGQREFGQFANPSETPTTGMMADDIGMAMQENAARAKDPKRFEERDAARRSLASDKIGQTAPAGAEGRDFTGRAEDIYDETLGGARRRVDEARLAQQGGQRMTDQQAAELGEYRTRQGEASANLDVEYKTSERQARAKKNRLYESVPNEEAVPNSDAMIAAIDEADAATPTVTRRDPAYRSLMDDIKMAIDAGVDEDGNPLTQDMTYGDLKALRAKVKEARTAKVAAGGDAAHLDQIGSILSGKIDEMNPEAARYYREEYAPRYKTGRAGEYTSATKRAARTGEESSATRPSEFGDKFLRKPEDAAALQRAVDVNGNPVTAQNATDWMLGDLAKSNVLSGKAELRYDRFKAWADKNKAVIDQFPEMRKRVDAELDRARTGGRLSAKLAKDVADAETNLKTTESDLRRSALQSAIGNSPENAVGSIMGSGDPSKRMAEMVGRLKGDQKALDGLKAATRDWIRQKVGTTARNVGAGGEAKNSWASLDKLFTQHEKTLSKLYTPDEMNALRQAHKLLGADANRNIQTTTGSNTFDKFMAGQKNTTARRMRMVEAGLKAKYGVLKGGGVFRTIRLFLDTIEDSSRADAVENILFEMHFDPDLAKHLLTRDVKEVGTPGYNRRLNRLLAAAAGARAGDSVESSEEDRPPLEVTVRPKRSD